MLKVRQSVKIFLVFVRETCNDLNSHRSLADFIILPLSQPRCSCLKEAFRWWHFSVEAFHSSHHSVRQIRIDCSLRSERCISNHFALDKSLLKGCRWLMLGIDRTILKLLSSTSLTPATAWWVSCVLFLSIFNIETPTFLETVELTLMSRHRVSHPVPDTILIFSISPSSSFPSPTAQWIRRSMDSSQSCSD